MHASVAVAEGTMWKNVGEVVRVCYNLDHVSLDFILFAMGRQ